MDAMKITIECTPEEAVQLLQHVRNEQTTTVVQTALHEITIRDAAKRLGRMTSQRKALASVENGRKGGRPRRT